MVLKDNLRYAYLIKVDATENNNKFYEMIERSGGMIELFNGRVESTKITQKPKPASQWDKIYKSKIKKLYSDMTEFRSVKIDQKTNSTHKDISDSKIAYLIDKLQNYAGNSVSANYSVKSVSVTQKMVDEAQTTIDTITKKLKMKSDIGFLNDRLQYLFTVIPRKMTKVSNHLFHSLKDKDSLIAAKEIMFSEQDTLDSMAGQVIQNAATIVDDGSDSIDKSQSTILDDLGISIVQATPQEIEQIAEGMLDHGGSYRGSELLNAFKVYNSATEKVFSENLKQSKNKNTMLMWHGSRNQNWMFILSQGLKIRPSNAIHSGSMFGDSIYGADANGVTTPLGNPNPGYAKAYGYTSSSRAYWSGGGSGEHVYMAVMEFHVGNQKHIYAHDSSCYSLNKKDLNKKGFDSVYAHGRNDGGKGNRLINSEFMVYDANQVTIRYLLELKN